RASTCRAVPRRGQNRRDRRRRGGRGPRRFEPAPRARRAPLPRVAHQPRLAVPPRDDRAVLAPFQPIPPRHLNPVDPRHTRRRDRAWSSRSAEPPRAPAHRQRAIDLADERCVRRGDHDVRPRSPPSVGPLADRGVPATPPPRPPPPPPPPPPAL